MEIEHKEQLKQQEINGNRMTFKFWSGGWYSVQLHVDSNQLYIKGLLAPHVIFHYSHKQEASLSTF